MIRHFLRAGGWVALLFVAIAVAFGGFWSYERATARALDDHGLASTATVEAKHVETRRRRSRNGTRTDTDYLVTYAFTAQLPDGSREPWRIEHGVPRWIYEDLSLGERVEVRYLPERPTRADFFPGEAAREASFFGWFALAMLAVAALLGAFFARAARRALRLEAHGVPVEGTVENVRRSRSGASFSLRFRDSTGTERRATAPAVKGPHWEGLQPGAAVSLRYDPQDPSHVALA